MRKLLLLLCILPTVIVPACIAEPITPPRQPANGPGGLESACQKSTSQEFLNGAKGYWIFEPRDPAPDKAPVVVFLHGWSALQPNVYGRWIEHIVRRGNIVIYPVYQDSLLTPIADFTANAEAGLQDALARLQTEPGHVRPLLNKFALVGHSMGAELAANLAASWQEAGLPKPRAVFCVEPGKTSSNSNRVGIALADLSRIPQETLLLTLVGDRDRIVGDIDAKRIFRESSQVPSANKNYVTLVSDDHGTPALAATHFAPLALGTCDALDFYGTWKLFDALTDAAFDGRNREVALGNTAAQRFMGKWTDGTPVKEMRVTDNP